MMGSCKGGKKSLSALYYYFVSHKNLPEEDAESLVRHRNRAPFVVNDFHGAYYTQTAKKLSRPLLTIRQTYATIHIENEANSSTTLIVKQGMQTYKTKLIFDNPKVKTFWVGQICLVRDCYNYISKIAFAEKTPLHLKEFHNRFYRAEREAFPTLPAQMCIKIYKQVLANYRTVR